MQIRAATRQDEALIRNIVFGALEELGIAPDPDGRDNDLKNVEQNYFWHDGICLVAEREGQILGVVAARRHKNDDELELVRLAVHPGSRNKGVGRALMNTLLFFGANMEYKRLLLGTELPSSDLARLPETILTKLGLSQSQEGWFMSIPGHPRPESVARIR